MDAENAGAAMTRRVSGRVPALKGSERLPGDRLRAAHAIDGVREHAVVGIAEGDRGVADRALLDLHRWRERRSEEHTSELQSQSNLVCRLLLEKKKKKNRNNEEEK